MPEFDDKELIRLQNEAMMRAAEMQRRARMSFEPELQKAVPAEPQNASAQSSGRELVLILMALIGNPDPILSAALGYLL